MKRIERSGALYTWIALGFIAGCGEASNEPVGVTPRAEDPIAKDTPAGGSSAIFSAEAGVKTLQQAHPSANVRVQSNRIQRVYGVVATGDSPRVAAENFRKNNAAALGVNADDLVATGSEDGIGLMFDPATGKHKFRLFTYEQQRDGVPVFQSSLRALVREDDADHPVVWANVDLRPVGRISDAARSRSGAPSLRGAVDLDRAIEALRGSRALRGLPLPTALTHVSTPTATIFAGTGSTTQSPRLAARYRAQDASGPGKWTFIADAETGAILHVESNVHFDVSGTVQGEVTTGSQSMECGQLGVEPLPHAEVTSTAGNAFTNDAGAFTIVQSGSSPLTLVSSLMGQYFDVSNEAGDEASISLQVTPPGPANFLHEDPAATPELVLAQLNAYKHANELRDLLLTYVPGYPQIASQTNFPINVNRADLTCEVTGGAWYDDDSAIRSLNFCQRTAERTNTAFGGIVHHEYAHHIIDAGGSAQNEYGEGMADAVAMLLSKDPRIAVGYYLNQCTTSLRNADNDCQYSETDCSSCGSGLYECGALITGTIWDIWQQLDASEPAASDDIIRALVLSSIPLHTGDSIDPSIAIDLLTLDDDDPLIENGTPHYAEICAGFQRHGMDCPPIVDGLVVKGTDLDAEGPSDGPFEPVSVSYTLYNLGPQQTLSYSVNTPPDALWLNVDNGSGTIPLGEQVTVTISIDQAQAALLTDGDYSAQIELVNETSGVGTVSRQATLRVGAPMPIYTATFDGGLDGYTADTEVGNLWHASTLCVDGLPGHSTGGSLYYGKDDGCNYTTPVPIRHTITSPPIAITNPAMAELGLNYYLATENDPNYDTASVLVSVAGGPFEVVASNNLGGAKLNETNIWTESRFGISSLLPASGPTSIRVQLAFNAGDPNSNTKTGFAVDDLTVYAQIASCNSDAECSDGLYCNGVEACVDQACVAGTAITCDDGVECTVDTCDEGTDSCLATPGDDCAPTNAFIEANGVVVMEAEHFFDNTARGAHRWDQLTNGQASGGAQMTANPNLSQFINNNYAATSPELSYVVNFTRTGTYYVWVRGIGATANDDSCHVGIDGAEIATADRITGFTSGLSWTRNTIDGPVATLRVLQPGYHDINVWMREDGFVFDKLVLTTNQGFAPWGNGPVESQREGQTSERPCASLCSNPVVFNSTNYQSGNLGTAATCHETMGPLNGAVCGNFANGRRLTVNGVQVPCNWNPWPWIPPARNGGYCFQSNAGNYAWAAFTTW